MSIADRLAEIKRRVAAAETRSGRAQGSVLLIAVSKTKPAEAITEAARAGQVHFGENYAQELRDKLVVLPDPKLCWHFIGHLQKNKVKYVAGKVYEVHTVDSVDLAAEIGRKASTLGVRQRVMIEVNVGGEEQKSGVGPEAATGLCRAVMETPGVELVGLMTMPPLFDDPETTRLFYRALRELRDRLRLELDDPVALPELSMGLSHDFEVAIEEGATRVRVGTAIFGERG